MKPLIESWSDAAAGPLNKALEARRRAGLPIIDLITTNPHEAGLCFPPDDLRAIVDDALTSCRTVSVYTPDPRGQAPARQAIAAYYAARGTPVDANQIVLTPGTSMGYFQAIRLLTQPGDDILVPKPGYPLLDDLADICGTQLRRYHLRPGEGGWRIDPGELEFQITPRTRAVVIVSPHNPTGSVASSEELATIGAVCRRHGIALLFDEVFCEFLHPDTTFPRPRAADSPLCVTLNGFSKMLSLPQWKIAWMAVSGDDEKTKSFLAALEHLSDAFLPVNELAQAMIPSLLDVGARKVIPALAAAYRDRLQLAITLCRHPTHMPEGGVYLCARLPEGAHDENHALSLLSDHGVLVHPGYYYDMPGHIVMTAVATPEQLRLALARV